MTMDELYHYISYWHGGTIQDANSYVHSVFKSIEEILLSGDSVNIENFGSFKLKDYKSRCRRNVSTGEKMIVPGYTGVKFRPSHKLKNKLMEKFKPTEPEEISDTNEYGKTPERNI